jgi:glycosyltransferase involved in cell wall biosynthesis
MHRKIPAIGKAIFSRLDSIYYYRKVDADIYHSQEASYNTLVAQLAVPNRLHVITFQDPYDTYEWRRISEVDDKYRLTSLFRTRVAIERRILTQACRNADALYSQARFLIQRARRLYLLGQDPVYLPNPIYMPQRRLRKSSRPKFCFLGRWDPQKRVEIFLSLAKKFPEIEFVAMGRSHNLSKDTSLRKIYKNLPNLKLTGFVTEDKKSEILEESWGLINTSIREALPVSFLEALAHETTIVSQEDPDFLTSKFGYLVTGADYEEAILHLLRDDQWYDKGRKGRRHVEQVYDSEKVIRTHISEYKKLLERVK